VNSHKWVLIYYLDMGYGPSIYYLINQPITTLQDMTITFDTNKYTYSAVVFCGSKTCTTNEACVEDMCIERGSLSIAARWSPRKGQGYLIVRTPLNNTIYFGKPRTNSSADEGQHEHVGDGSEVDNIYWTSNSVPPKRFYKICFSTGSP
jgi:hypothetical protein